MLVLTRKPGEQIRIGNDITVTVVETRGNRVRISIDAPRAVNIRRAELEVDAAQVQGWGDDPELAAKPTCWRTA